MMAKKLHKNRMAPNVMDACIQHKKYVVKHKIENMKLWFSLNCNEWIQDKTKVFNIDWTLFDQKGDLLRIRNTIKSKTKVVNKLLYIYCVQTKSNIHARQGVFFCRASWGRDKAGSIFPVR